MIKYVKNGIEFEPQNVRISVIWDKSGLCIVWDMTSRADFALDYGDFVDKVAAELFDEYENYCKQQIIDMDNCKTKSEVDACLEKYSIPNDTKFITGLNNRWYEMEHHIEQDIIKNKDRYMEET